jgi:hypothetical protein
MYDQRSLHGVKEVLEHDSNGFSRRPYEQAAVKAKCFEISFAKKD